MKQAKTQSVLVTMMLHLFLLMVASASAVAQTDKKEQSFRFVYIATDMSVDKKTLRDALKPLRDDAEVKSTATVFYLSNGSDPVIVEFNMNYESESQKESLLANSIGMYDSKLIYSINNNLSQPAEADFDRSKVKELLSKYGVINEEGQSNYKDFFMDFHVGKRFWDMHRNESIIGALYFDLDFSKYYGNNDYQFVVNFYCPPAMDKYNHDKSFGDLNPDDMNRKVLVRWNSQRL